MQREAGLAEAKDSHSERQIFFVVVGGAMAASLMEQEEEKQHQDTLSTPAQTGEVKNSSSPAYLLLMYMYLLCLLTNGEF